MASQSKHSQPPLDGTIEIEELFGSMKEVREQAQDLVADAPGAYLLAWNDPRGVSERHTIWVNYWVTSERIAELCRRLEIRLWWWDDYKSCLSVFLRTSDSEAGVAALLEAITEEDDPAALAVSGTFTDVVLGHDGKQLQPFRPVCPVESDGEAPDALLIRLLDPTPSKPIEIGSTHCVYYKGEYHSCTVLAHNAAKGTWKVKTLLGSTITIRDALQFVSFPPNDGTGYMTDRSAKFSGCDLPFTVIQFGGFAGQRRRGGKPR